eukprot:gnl/MRDRNA2_/MRDRNA2_36277_c0_seq1.p1 gnl/MRDRNA2_/MRDRNA2_36277_c0~~gnl/MRDRNA2_/MRDRNA2_36277_c0_seq1.p1  ORF type:complete len:110 (+),score=6.13 gnl/MRDRNA2_/MRDRNA2_36277_c0_seq1:181-510(+)
MTAHAYARILIALMLREVHSSWWDCLRRGAVSRAMNGQQWFLLNVHFNPRQDDSCSDGSSCITLISQPLQTRLRWLLRVHPKHICNWCPWRFRLYQGTFCTSQDMSEQT